MFWLNPHRVKTRHHKAQVENESTLMAVMCRQVSHVVAPANGNKTHDEKNDCHVDTLTNYFCFAPVTFTNGASTSLTL